jgi:AAA domain
LAEHWGINGIIYGPAKAGKSWVGDTTPAPRLVLDAEAGSRFTPSRKVQWDPVSHEPPEPDGSWDTALVTVRDYRTLTKAYEWTSSGKHPFRSVVLDSISEAQQRCVDEMKGTSPMQQQDWGQLLRVVSDLARKFRDLTTHPTNPLDAVIIIAMVRERNGVQEPYVQGQLATTLPYYFDLCTYLAPVPHPETGELIRRLFTGSFPGYVTGERVGGCLGSYIDNPNITSMLESVRAYLGTQHQRSDAPR